MLNITSHNVCSECHRDDTDNECHGVARSGGTGEATPHQAAELRELSWTERAALLCDGAVCRGAIFQLPYCDATPEWMGCRGAFCELLCNPCAARYARKHGLPAPLRRPRLISLTGACPRPDLQMGTPHFEGARRGA